MEENDNVIVSRGFPNPGASQLDQSLALNLNHLLIKRPSSSFIFRISGHAYSDQGIYDGDLVIIDRAAPTAATDLIMAWEDNAFRLMRLRQMNPETTSWGVVRSVIHNLN